MGPIEIINDLPAISFSGTLTLMTTNFINGPGEDEREMGSLEMFARKIIGSLCYAGLIVSSLVETVVRGLLAIPIAPVGYFFCRVEGHPHSNYFNEPTLYTLLGAVLSAENAIIATAAFVQNLYQEKLDFTSDDNSSLLNFFNFANKDVIFPIVFPAINVEEAHP